MTRNFPKISAQQLFCIMLLSRITMDAIAPPPAPNGAAEALAVIAVTEIARLALASPLIYFAFGKDNFHRYLYTKNRAWGWISAIFAAILLVGAAAKSLIHGTNFAFKNLVGGGASWTVFAAGLVFTVYAAYMGVEALARSGVLFLIAAAIITAAVFLADIPYAKITPLWNEGSFGTFFEDVLRCFSNGGEYLVFAALLPYVNRDDKPKCAGNAVLWFALISTLASSAICAVNYLILREMYPLTEYPFIAAASLSDIALFKRLDGISAAVWGLCAAFRSGLMLLSAWSVIMTVKRAAIQRKENRSVG